MRTFSPTPPATLNRQAVNSAQSVQQHAQFCPDTLAAAGHVLYCHVPCTVEDDCWKSNHGTKYNFINRSVKRKDVNQLYCSVCTHTKPEASTRTETPHTIHHHRAPYTTDTTPRNKNTISYDNATRCRTTVMYANYAIRQRLQTPLHERAHTHTHTHTTHTHTHTHTT